MAPFLARRMRPDAVLDWALSGRQLDAAEAFSRGLVTRLCDPGLAAQTATTMAKSWGTGGRPVVDAGMRWFHQAAVDTLTRCDEEVR